VYLWRAPATRIEAAVKRYKDIPFYFTTAIAMDTDLQPVTHSNDDPWAPLVLSLGTHHLLHAFLASQFQMEVALEVSHRFTSCGRL
jgi:hypothetical protein